MRLSYYGDQRPAAPMLKGVRLGVREPQQLCEELPLRNIELILVQGLIHGDLSDYNILY